MRKMKNGEERIMGKKAVNESQCIDIMNQILKSLPEYQPGMEFVAYPPGSTGANISGVCHKGPDLIMMALHSKVQKMIEEEYEVRVTT